MHVVRKIGRRMSDRERGQLTTLELVGNLLKFVRSDYGGKDPVQVVQKKLLELGVSAGEEECAAVVELIQQQLEGSRDRLRPTVEELRRRARV